MRKTYIFLIMIVIILYLSYLIVSYKYKEYKINNHIEYIQDENKKIWKEINTSKDSLEYLNTNAYKNKVLKEEQAMKNKWEMVIFITNEDNYNIYTKKDDAQNEVKIANTTTQIYDWMSIVERWVYFIFKKDIR